MWLFLIGTIIGVVGFIVVDLLVRRHNKKKQQKNDNIDIE